MLAHVVEVLDDVASRIRTRDADQAPAGDPLGRSPGGGPHPHQQPRRGDRETGEVFGTMAYMAPEHFFEESSVDHRIDVYALGVILYAPLDPGHMGQRREWVKPRFDRDSRSRG